MSPDTGTVLKRQLYETVLTLASDEGKIEERLSRAYFDHLQAIDGTAFPPDARKEYEDICAELRKMYPAPGTIDGVDRSAAVNLAMRIILIYDALVR